MLRDLAAYLTLEKAQVCAHGVSDTHHISRCGPLRCSTKQLGTIMTYECDICISSLFLQRLYDFDASKYGISEAQVCAIV